MNKMVSDDFVMLTLNFRKIEIIKHNKYEFQKFKKAKQSMKQICIMSLYTYMSEPECNRLWHCHLKVLFRNKKFKKETNYGLMEDCLA